MLLGDRAVLDALASSQALPLALRLVLGNRIRSCQP